MACTVGTASTSATDESDVASVAPRTPKQAKARVKTEERVAPTAYAAAADSAVTGVFAALRSEARGFKPALDPTLVGIGELTASDAPDNVAPPPAPVQAALDPVTGVAPSPRMVEEDAPVPAGGGRYMVGVPYQVAGRTYIPAEDPGYDAVGTASWYGSAFHGRKTANGELFDRHRISAAHPTLPLPCYVRVTNLDNHRSIIVRVNDRGPYVGDRLIDVSEQAAKVLGFRKRGKTKVEVTYVSQAPLDGDDTAKLLASYQGPLDKPRWMLASAEPKMPRPRPRTEPVVPDLVAFAPTEAAKAPGPKGSAMAAIATLTEPPSATSRILMAFDVARQVEE